MLAYTVSDELPPVWCVSGGLRQIMIHLLSNSIKFTPNGGQVWVKAKLQENYVQLEFRDTGIVVALYLLKVNHRKVLPLPLVYPLQQSRNRAIFAKLNPYLEKKHWLKCGVYCHYEIHFSP